MKKAKGQIGQKMNHHLFNLMSIQICKPQITMENIYKNIAKLRTGPHCLSLNGHKTTEMFLKILYFTEEDSYTGLGHEGK